MAKKVPPPHKIDKFEFQFWRGDPPCLEQQQVELITRPGTKGFSEVKIGKWGDTLHAQLVSHHVDYNTAMRLIPDYQKLIATGPQLVTYNSLDMVKTFKTGYTVQAVDFVSCQAHVALMGPGYLYIGGAELITRWTLTPMAWSGPKPAT